jgi:hypothetical protein
MALIVEDGSGLADAESYASVEYADAYFLARGKEAWAGIGDSESWGGQWAGVWYGLAPANKEAYLRRATDYMGAVFAMLWVGRRATRQQALDWPRMEWEGVPVPVVRACCELAFRAVAGPLMVDEGPRTIREKVGPIAVKHPMGASQQTRPAFVWSMLEPYLKPSARLYRR